MLEEYCIMNFISLDIFHFIESHVNHRLSNPCSNQSKPTRHFPLPARMVAEGLSPSSEKYIIYNKTQAKNVVTLA